MEGPNLWVVLGYIRDVGDYTKGIWGIILPSYMGSIS